MSCLFEFECILENEIALSMISDIIDATVDISQENVRNYDIVYD